ncbi:MAG: phosphopantothenoylcysteine decarboxylase [Kiritimatiellia bacterium]
MLVTAGPTREELDPVRFISNRSSGKMGYAVASSALARGHEVRLVSGPVKLTAPSGVHTVGVITAGEMKRAVHDNIEWCDVLVMAAAVSDWRPGMVSGTKLKKDSAPLTLALEPTEDILKSVAQLKGNRVYIGFAAETEDLIENGTAKLKEKNLDLIAVNNVLADDSGFECDTNRVILISAARTEELPLMPKREVADRIIEWAERSLS